MPLQPPARPAQTIVTTGIERPSARSRYGSMHRSASPSSTSVIVSCLPAGLALRAGANAAVPTMPTTIASIARCS
jgi:hypothetical protein